MNRICLCLHRFMLLFTAMCFILPLAAGKAGAQSQPPINIIFDMHADPLPQISFPQKAAYFQMQLDNGNWVLDRTEAIGVRISFLACGEFMEFVCDGGVEAAGAHFLERIYASGRQIGSHSHKEYRESSFNWPSFSDDAAIEESVRSWQDNIEWVNAAILTALGAPPPEPLDRINAVKGAHMPKTEEEYHVLMDLFDLRVREGGAEEDYYGIYNHYIMNPYRPSSDNYMSEDLDAPFVVVPQGAVIGKKQIHHGIYQDMTAPNVKRMFVQTYLNWRYRDRNGLGEKVWCFGWGSHNHDFEPGSQTRADMVEVIHWLDENFVGVEEPSGSVVARWSTQTGTGEEYFAWEETHPGESSFDSNGECIDWSDYRYLRAVCVELWNAYHVADLDLGDDLRAWHLGKGEKDIVVAFSDGAPAVRDLSMLITPPCRVVGAESGLLRGTDPTRMMIGAEPMIITELAPAIFIAGNPLPGQEVFITIEGEPGAEGLVYASLGTARIEAPHLGIILINPAKRLTLLGRGLIDQDGTFTLAYTISDDHFLVGRTCYVQGLEKRANGMTLTVNRLEVTIRPQLEDTE